VDGPAKQNYIIIIIIFDDSINTGGGQGEGAPALS
jgi:hypothetical protein